VVDIDVDVENSRLEAQELDDSEDDIYMGQK
jgi:hypothetical protein